MNYKKINNANELDEFLHNEWGDFSFINENNLIIKGVFYEEHEPDEYDGVERFFSDIWFEFGRTISPDEIKAPKGTVFEKLRLYGSSKAYSGLLSRKGDVLIPNVFNSIDYIGEGLFRVENQDCMALLIKKVEPSANQNMIRFVTCRNILLVL